MAAQKIFVPKYKARDGLIFDDKEEADEHDAIVGLSELINTQSTSLDFIKPEVLFKFLYKNRDEIIELMGWENDDESND